MLSLFIILSNSFNLKIEENIILSDKNQTRCRYNISTNKKYKINSSSDKYIYFLELLNDIEVQDKNNQNFTKFACIASQNDYLIINPKEGNEKDIYFEVTSILNNNVEAKMENRHNFHFLSLLNKNLINIIYTEQKEIIALNSLEKSIAFSYWKYEYLEGVNPGNIYPINRTLFTRYNESIMTLVENSVYIFIAEKYKIDSPINSIDIFVSPLEVEENINLEYDMIYLKENGNNYNISFQNKNLFKILKLSKKTINSIIK